MGQWLLLKVLAAACVLAASSNIQQSTYTLDPQLGSTHLEPVNQALHFFPRYHLQLPLLQRLAPAGSRSGQVVGSGSGESAASCMHHLEHACVPN